MNNRILAGVFMISVSISMTSFATQYFEPRTPEEVAEFAKVFQVVNDNMDLIKKYPYTRASVDAADAFVNTFKFFQTSEPRVFKSCDTLVGNLASKVYDLSTNYFAEFWTPENEKVVCEILNSNIAIIEGDCRIFIKDSLEPFAKKTLKPAFENLVNELDAAMGDKSIKLNDMLNGFKADVEAELAKQENKEALGEFSAIYVLAKESAGKVFKKYFNKKKSKKIA
jgi:hypothetical protein